MASIAFLLGRRAPTRRFTYGFGSVEDVAGVIVVLVIAASAVAAGLQSVRRLADPVAVGYLGALTSLAVLLSAGGMALGWQPADPIVGRDPHATHVPRSSRSSAPA